jgi:cytochrome P450
MVRAAYRVIAATILPSDHVSVTTAIEQSAAAFAGGMPWAIAVSALNLPEWMPFPGKRAMGRETRDLRDMVGDMIEERRRQPTGKDDLFSRLLSARDPEGGREMSDEQLVDNLLTFLFAGHDTTSKALTWALYLVSRTPEWEAVIREEVEAVAGDRPIGAEHVAGLQRTQQFIKETMRLFPPVPTMTRIAAADTELGGQPIAAGTLIVVPIYVIHRHTALWDDPERFDPARFTTEKERSYPRNQYLPFGAGPRLCVGAAFALVEATVALATLVHAARFRYAGGQAPDPVARVVLAPRQGMPMHVTLR